MEKQALKKRIVYAVLGFSAFVAACSASALPPINTTKDGVALKGYDPVAYYTVGSPVKGSMDYEYRWKGAVWRFSSEEHMRLFMSDPDKYAPRYGGY